MNKLGLDYESLSKMFPRLIHVSRKGFLPGPYENRLALDEVAQSIVGLTYMTGPKGRWSMTLGSKTSAVLDTKKKPLRINGLQKNWWRRGGSNS